MNKTSLAIFAAALIVGLTIGIWPRLADGPVSVRMPAALTADAQLGRGLFDKNCQNCHGESASGTTNGPPLVHKIYEPNHHSDKSIHRAVREGVQPHHWQFGQMPSIDHVGPKQVDLIIRYVRELQRANGIF